MTTVEGTDSNNFTATLTGGVPTGYAWSFTAPGGAGNNPDVDFSAPAAMTTKVKKAHWFADPDNRLTSATGTTSTYTIEAEITIQGGGTCDDTASFTVQVDATGQTTWPRFVRWTTIVIKTRVVGGGATEWYVDGQGTFARTAPVASVNCVAASQFFAKVTAHENKHVTQWTAEAPWKDLFHADNLYNNTLKNLTSLVSAADLRGQIVAAVGAQHNADAAVARNTVCAREIAAFAVDDAVAPHYQEVDATEVPALYNCVP